MTVKRSRAEAEESMVDCLMLLSKIGENPSRNNTRVFECKSCKKQFLSFQALGGHVASHKKLKLMASEFLHQSGLNSCKIKKHECHICGVEFQVGQALGGHMRRHRVAAAEKGGMVAVLKRSNSKRVFGLDLNLTPLENDLKLEMKMAPVSDFLV